MAAQTAASVEQSRRIGDRIMESMKFIDSIRVTDSSADNKALQEAATRIKGIAVRLQLGRSSASEKSR